MTFIVQLQDYRIGHVQESKTIAAMTPRDAIRNTFPGWEPADGKTVKTGHWYAREGNFLRVGVFPAPDSLDDAVALAESEACARII